MSGHLVDVLMATYNGARYVEEQIASLAAQDCRDWHLLMRDDGSSDDTPAIARRCAEFHGIAFTVIEDGRRGLGACGAFAALLEASKAPYFACCDQDDVWLSSRLRLTLEAVQRAETASGKTAPCLAFCDLVPVDSDLRPLASSFRDYAGMRIPSGRDAWQHLMIENCVTGCASLGNAALRSAASPIPGQAMMHDWWLALVAATQGVMVDVPDRLVLYRQHGGNALGAQRAGPGRMARRIVEAPIGMLAHARSWGQGSMRQAAVFAERYEARIDPLVAARFREFGSLHERGLLARKTFVPRHRVATNSPLRVLALTAAL